MLFAFCRTSSTTSALFFCRVYTMHSIQPAQHLHSLVQTKNRSLLRHRGLKMEDLTFKMNVTNGGVDSPQSRGSSYSLLIACGHQTTARKILIELSIASYGVRQRFWIEMTAENVAFVYTVHYNRSGQPINDCPHPR